jgi:hypothetical protein
MAVLDSFSDSIKNSLKCFGVIGWKPYKPEAIKPETGRKTFLKAYFCINVIILVVGAALFIASIGVNFERIGKSLGIFMNKEKLKETVETLDELFPRTKKEQEMIEPKK